MVDTVELTYNSVQITLPKEIVDGVDTLYSGIDQGKIVSFIVFNVLLERLDKFNKVQGLLRLPIFKYADMNPRPLASIAQLAE